ncbi:S41 family peptidase [Chryseobacterium carnipullorum]|uniref:S41 family peptidase n=1 Tax=Chryseobacterium carnipullorum TaxID=1124835 RepID=UPI0009FA7E01|nr:S41 family peptidase [Chryseobacterium carnipullorum]
MSNRVAERLKFSVRNTVLFCFLTFVMQMIPAQNYSKKAVLNDLNYFETVIKGHPLYSDYLDSSEISEVISAGREEIQTDSISFFQYRIILGKIFYKLGCIHTGVTKPRFTPEHKVPLEIMINNGFFITMANDKKWIGSRIISINNIPIEKIFSNLNQMVGSDGGGSGFGEYFFIRNFSVLLAEYFAKSDAVTVLTGTGTFDLYKVPVPERIDATSPEKKKTYSAVSMGTNSLQMAGNTGILKISGFDGPSKRFFTKVFRFFKDNNTENLIIDLRGNLGGSMRSAMFLCQNLVSEPFGYDIDYRKSDLFRHLNTKGKLYFCLSKVKYTFENIFSSKKINSDTRAYRYRYRSLKNNNIKSIKILTDEGTASSSTMCVTILKRKFENVKIIGTRPSGGYNGNNGGAFPTVTLPETKIEVKIPLYRIVLDRNSTQRQGITPDFELETDVESFLSNDDNVLRNALEVY